MKREFQQIDVECWVHPGRLGLAEPSICLCHRRPDLGGEILRALREMEAEAPHSKRMLTFTVSQRTRAISTLRLRLVPPRPDLRVMNIARENDVAVIEMTGTRLQLVQDALRTWCDGVEDFGVSPRHAGLKKRELGALDKSSGELWFWGPTMEP